MINVNTVSQLAAGIIFRIPHFWHKCLASDSSGAWLCCVVSSCTFSSVWLNTTSAILYIGIVLLHLMCTCQHTHTQSELVDSFSTARAIAFSAPGIVAPVDIIFADAVLYGNRNFRSQELSLPGTKVPPMELSLSGVKISWNFRSRERKWRGTQERKSHGTFALNQK